jgi:hypothetical protein
MSRGFPYSLAVGLLAGDAEPLMTQPRHNSVAVRIHMSWLADLEYTHEFICKNTGKRELVRCKASEQPVAPVVEGHEFEHRGFLPVKMGGCTKVEYEQNGRKGIRITDGNGGVQHRAKTKDTYLKTGKIPDDTPQSKDSVAEKQFLQSMTQPQ